MIKKLWILTGILVFGMAASFIFAQDKQGEVMTRETAESKQLKEPSVEPLNVVGSFDAFKKMIKNIEKDRGEISILFSSDTAESAESEDGSSGADYSTTNVQVNGVDEADHIKTDGTYMYQIKENQLIISSVYPANEMKVVYQQKYEDDFNPSDLYVDEKQLIVIGHSRFNDPTMETDAKSNPYFFPESGVKVLVYELKDRHNLELVREVEIEGHYNSSRKIGNSLYVVSNKYIPVHILERDETVDENLLKPAYKDSVLGEEIKRSDWDEIYYLPEFDEPNYLIVSGIDLSNHEKPASVSTYLGASQNLYASKDHLYVTIPTYEESGLLIKRAIDINTAIFKFKLANGTATFIAEGEVEGRILNQFSMDEHNGHFRIATTTGEVWDETNPSKNHLFILDQNLKKTGEIRDIAPKEVIYSVRFMGDRGYMVTFKKVDPLFVFDLKDPNNPTILGKLKTPGYSDYLHPYDENHIIGFGKDAVEATKGDFAYYQGMKMALFDITDVNNPKEKFVEIIGDRGTDSELLYNHKALLFSKEKNLIAFPVNLYQLPDGIKNPEGDAYGEFTFQGAFVYGLDLENGFTLKKQITHISDGDALKMGYYPDFDKGVQRIMYIEHTIYTISNHKIEAHHINTFNKLNEVVLP
ncbi:MAG TPA: beta-propeller domain-containing protein [Bacillus sp. (in: firmicutes)]|nr:beta-propeller domain-containing protein [Bacillus sp. (in: firmicutes)]